MRAINFIIGTGLEATNVWRGRPRPRRARKGSFLTLPRQCYLHQSQSIITSGMSDGNDQFGAGAGKANRGVEGQTLSPKAESVSPKHWLRPPRTTASGVTPYGLTSTFPPPSLITLPHHFPLHLP